PENHRASGVDDVVARASATRSLSCPFMVVTTWAPASYKRTPPFTTSRARGTTRAPTTGSSRGAVRTTPTPIKLVETTEPRVISSKRAITYFPSIEWHPSLPCSSAPLSTRQSHREVRALCFSPFSHYAPPRRPHQGRPLAGSTPVTALTLLEIIR